MNLYKLQNKSQRLAFLRNSFVQFVLGWLFVIYLPAAFAWGWDIWQQTQENRLLTLAYLSFGMLTVHVFMHKLSRYPGALAAMAILPALLLVATVGAIGIIVFRIPYSNTLLLPSFALSLIWFYWLYYFLYRTRNLTLAFVPFGRYTPSDLMHKQLNLIPLTEARLPEQTQVDAIIADLSAAELDRPWQQFLTQSALQGIPVYSAKQLGETISGRVKLDHLTENQLGQLAPPLVYSVIKRIIDITLVLISSPVWLPVVLITAVFIKRETPGPALFIQERMGYKGKIFKAYKLRSMRTDLEGSSFTQDEDPRITKIGRFIRKTRIDELPQFINVLKGEMSLIGPRPESLTLAEWYEKEIPFFAYRHIVRPGITGWAQVTQGYAAEIDGMTEKLEHDFFYIKRFSLWLDFLITVKTIKTMLTGFGSR